MQNKRNYQKELEKRIASFTERPSLLLHSCCAPCSSYCLEYLAEHFDITVFYYNPNITDREEYAHRVSEQQRLIKELSAEFGRNIAFAEGNYEPELFLEKVKGLEKCPEGGERCRICFELRLRTAGSYALAHGFDLFTTTLTISPLKNAELLNTLGTEIGSELGIEYLCSDFKKNNGYKRSVELSEKYGLYRQDYCGCAFSKAESLERQRSRKEVKAG